LKTKETVHISLIPQIVPLTFLLRFLVARLNTKDGRKSVYTCSGVIRSRVVCKLSYTAA